ncbi:Golgi-specific brefeldin A-resistance guanine nucleotide exchange factor 1 [Leptopilina heterotoma]|uniref:Golgi-specific brefeldin A-resistance guanine nucleotide exchange factor 1 n=1 Tax=Leptopilina heterotoma TaxID=63436 RepID=UPI001CAA28B6|nr:Golgi-specific brefeldin A-resistance guanine nucleotide exchange factor 1 [Leptopilina heterotoma]
MSRIQKMPCPGGGLYVLEGEVGLLVTAMRRGVRWSSHSHQDEDQDVLMKGLSSLKEALNEAKDISQLEPAVFMAPFLEIIRSEETTGPVTSLALSAVNKIISYGLIDPEHPAIAPCVEAVADAVTHARFVGTDASGDGVVLMRILQVLRALMLSPSGDHLSNESICEIMLSCFRICFESRLSELLRRTAEHCLRDMVQHLFTRLPHFIDDSRGLLNMKKMRTNNMDNTRSKSRKTKNHSKSKSQPNPEEIEDAESQLLSPVDRVRANHLATTPVTPAGNIVDMQGSLDQSPPEKIEDDKSDNKNSVAKTLDLEAKEENQEVNKEQVSNDLTTENTSDCKASQNECESSSENKNIVETVEKETIECLEKENVPDCQESREEDKTDWVQSPAGSVEDLSSVDESSSGYDVSKIPKIRIEDEPLEEYVNTQGVRFMPHQQHTPYGSLCVRELFRFLASICNPLDKQNTEVMMHSGLSLLQVALEISADSLSNFTSLLALAKDDLSRNLILLLGSDRLSILAANLQVSFLLFESQREHLKFQLEHYITKLMEIVNSESNRISYEQRELALEAIVRLWRIPGLAAELYLNYDCGLYSTNLYEESMKLLSRNASSFMGTMYSMQFISLDAIFNLIAGMEARCKGLHDLCKTSRHAPSPNLPTRDELLTTKANKRWLALGTEKFNENPRKGIAKLAEHGLLGENVEQPDPEKIAKYLRENPGLDKKAIGEYISKKENKTILNCFVHNFDLGNTRIDQALRLYLESFRLPGEAALISLLLEKFAEHWHDSNGRPFASADAAFTLAYAVIILNVDQHNYNAKRQINPMNADDFKRNLKKVNGDEDFDQEMLDEIYTSIKNEEIVMPAEQTGLVKENYLWKVLLRRSCGPESSYLKVGSAGEFVDKELAERAWAPIVSALCRAFDKAPDKTLQRRVAQAFLSCAAISAHYGMTSDLDTLIVSICKFTGLAAGGEPDQVVLHLGSSGRCQLAAHTLFKITHMHGDALRASWKNIVDCLQTLFLARVLPKNLTEGEDFLDVTGKISLIREPSAIKAAPVEQGILSSLYSYIALHTTKVPHPAEIAARERAAKCIANCHLKQIIEESKFLQVESLRSLIGALVSVKSQDEDLAVFLLECLLEVTIQNRDRVVCIWPVVQAHLDGLLTTAARENQPYLLERVAVGMLRLAIRLLRGEELACTVLPPLTPLTYLPSVAMSPLSRQIAYGLSELLKTGAANIHTNDDWKVIFSLLECVGAGALQSKQTNPVLDEASPRNSILDSRPISPVPEWVLVSPTGTEAPLPVAADTIVLDRDLQPHDPAALVKCVESLSFLVRDVAHVTPFNFELCVRCVRTFSEAVLQCAGKRSRVLSAVDEPANYQQSPIQLLELMHTLHTRTAQVFQWWAQEGETTDISLWAQGWRPLLQGIARLCGDCRRPVRASAITYLQSLLAHELTQLTGVEWSQCLEQVLFPLFAQLLGQIAPNDPTGVEETRFRAATLLSKVFLHHLTPLLSLPGFLPLWLTVLDLLRAFMHADNSELLLEAIPESLKNMLLVMSSAGVLVPESNLWAPTWRTIDGFLPNLRTELFPDLPPVAQTQPLSQSPQPQVISLVDQQQPSFPGSIAPQPEIQSTVQNESHVVDEDNDRMLNAVENGILRSTGVIAATILPSSEKKEAAQQVITLVNQPPPSVSSPVAIQPSAQKVFDFYRPLSQQHPGIPVISNQDIEKNSTANEENIWHTAQHIIAASQDISIVPQVTTPQHQLISQQIAISQQITSQQLTSQQINQQITSQQITNQQLTMPQQISASHQIISNISQYPQNSFPQSHEFHYSGENNLSHSVKSHEATVEEGKTATIFNSAAYFNEDPAADRLFDVRQVSTATLEN